MAAGSNERKQWLSQMKAVVQQKAGAAASDSASATNHTHPQSVGNMSQRVQWLAALQPPTIGAVALSSDGDAERPGLLIIDITKDKIEMAKTAESQTTTDTVKRRSYTMWKKRLKRRFDGKVRKRGQSNIQQRRGDATRISGLLTSRCRCASGTCWRSLASYTSDVVELIQAFNGASHSVQNRLLWSGSTRVTSSSVRYRLLNCSCSMSPTCFAELFSMSRTRCTKALQRGCVDARAFVVHHQPKHEHCKRWLLGQYCSLAEPLPNRMHKDWGLRKPKARRNVGTPNDASSDSEDAEMLKWCGHCEPDEEDPGMLELQDQELDRLIWQVINADSSLWVRLCVNPGDLPKRYCALLLNVFNELYQASPALSGIIMLLS